MDCAVTILLNAEKIKNFYPLLQNNLPIFEKFFYPDFRMKHAGLGLIRGGAFMQVASAALQAAKWF